LLKALINLNFAGIDDYLSTRILFIPYKTNTIGYYYLYQGNWFDTAVAATLMTLPVLALSAFLQRYLRETSLAGVTR
jgi:ABC-type glycerol-3-phosphate transport system permease component